MRTNEKSVDMEEKDLKWYSPFVFFVGAILSFADPITGILTLYLKQTGHFLSIENLTKLSCFIDL